MTWWACTVSCSAGWGCPRRGGSTLTGCARHGSGTRNTGEAYASLSSTASAVPRPACPPTTRAWPLPSMTSRTLFPRKPFPRTPWPASSGVRPGKRALSRPGAACGGITRPGSRMSGMSVDAGDDGSLLRGPSLLDQQPDRARGRRGDLHIHLVDRDLGEQIAPGDLLTISHEPGGDDPFGVRPLAGHEGEGDVGHAFTALRSASAMRDGVGRTAYSSERAYGIGTSGTHTRAAGARSSPGSCSATLAMTSPYRPNDR